MQTSYFAKSGRNKNAVAITIRKPRFFKGRHYPKLAPPEWLLDKYKKDGDSVFYRKHYIGEVLDKLNCKEVYEELGENAILVCWEGKDKFCHRHIIAEWLMERLGFENGEGIEIKEIR